MYENFYALKEKPFQITPNPDYLYLSPVHENALTYLEYGLMENVGFILLTGEVGAGKTTLVRYLTGQFESEKEIAVVFNTNVTPEELLCLILKSFKLEPVDGNKTKNLDILQQFLIDRYSKNKQVLLIIDEAQNLSDEVLEEVRMFSNLQSDEQNLIQIMFVGQPELKERLKQHGHNPLSQRIAVNFFLSGLTDTETRSYIAHRLKKAGGNPDMFSPEAVDMIYRASRGIPRTINLLCDAALVYGFGYEFDTIEAPVIEQVIKDKGGMGINIETENEMGPFSFHDEHDTDDFKGNRMKRLEDFVVLMKRQVDYVEEQMAKLEEKIKGLQEKLDGSLKSLLVEERKRNDQLLLVYSKLKRKYDSLLSKEDDRDTDG
ncbi:MAG: AAA family ATPase [Deltaproteobacteria bacterium]|nr:AAA family ATPase [Deltaproteobacteria bacterium]